MERGAQERCSIENRSKLEVLQMVLLPLIAINYCLPVSEWAKWRTVTPCTYQPDSLLVATCFSHTALNYDCLFTLAF